MPHNPCSQLPPQPPPGFPINQPPLACNYPFDSAGEPDTRPGTWGTTAFDDGRLTFPEVPEGYRVRILRVRGDCVAWPHGEVQPGKSCGLLFGLITTGSQAHVPAQPLSSDGCMIYIQDSISDKMPNSRMAFDVDCSACGLLDADNILVVRRAIFMSELGCNIHMEPSFVMYFSYEKAP